MNNQWTFLRKKKSCIISMMACSGLCAMLCACGTAKVQSRREVKPVPMARPEIVYVLDFDVDPATLKSEKGLLSNLPKAPGQLGQLLPPLPGTPRDPHVVARELVDSMSISLVNGLSQAGVNSRRLILGEKLPNSGWLVRGIFTEVNQGNRMRRAMIGFGAGKTELHVLVDIHDLSQGAPELFCEMSTMAESSKAPGAAPTIVLGPAGAAARYVIAGQDLNRNVKQTASQIAMEIVARTQPAR